MRNRAMHRKRQPLSGWNAPHNHLQLKHVTVVIDANQKEISPLGLNVPYAVFLQLMLKRREKQLWQGFAKHVKILYTLKGSYQGNSLIVNSVRQQ